MMKPSWKLKIGDEYFTPQGDSLADFSHIPYWVESNPTTHTFSKDVDWIELSGTNPKEIKSLWYQLQ